MPGGGSPAGGAITVARFSLTIDGVEIASFSELGGITSEAEPDDLAGRVLKKLPGKRKPPTVTLTRGLTGDLQLFAWQQSVRDGQVGARKNADLVMFDAAGAPVARYHLQNAWPSVLSVTEVTSGSNDILMETVTLACEKLDRLAP
jgi:phage tail-like protein